MEIVRAAVLKPESIDIGHIDEEVEGLIKPFTHLPLLLEIAEREVMHVNTFRIPEAFSESSSGSRVPTMMTVDINAEEEELLDETSIWINKTTKVSERSKEIWHLRSYITNVLIGGKIEIPFFHLSLMDPPLSLWVRTYHDLLRHFFPKLKTLDIGVNTLDAPRDQIYWTVKSEPGTEFHALKSLMGSLAGKEAMLRTQDLLLLTDTLKIAGLK